MSIEQLGLLTPINDSTFFAANLNGQDYRANAVDIAAYIAAKQAEVAAPSRLIVYASPSTPGFNVVLPQGTRDIWLLLTPTVPLASGTITLPATYGGANNFEIALNTTQAITALTINGNGSAVLGGITTPGANGFCRFFYDHVTNTYYRTG